MAEWLRCPPRYGFAEIYVFRPSHSAAEVSRPIHEARDLNLPVEPGVRDGRNALVRWAVLLQEVLP